MTDGLVVVWPKHTALWYICERPGRVVAHFCGLLVTKSIIHEHNAVVDPRWLRISASLCGIIDLRVWVKSPNKGGTGLDEVLGQSCPDEWR